MRADRVSGTEGYAEAAAVLLESKLPFVDLHRGVLHLIPARPSKILDVGSGPGHDAAAFAEMGHRVLAVEPTRELRDPAKVLYPSPLIEWVDDSLPDLQSIRIRGEAFDLVMISGVWMHLDQSQRRAAMPVVASVLAAQGSLIMSLRHGAVPRGRRMFEVTAEETIELANDAGLRPIVNLQTDSVHPANRAAGVRWTRLAFNVVRALSRDP
jgi:SAM-dependent methyltransferase